MGYESHSRRMAFLGVYAACQNITVMHESCSPSELTPEQRGTWLSSYSRLPPSITYSTMPPANPKKPDAQATANSRNEYIPSFIAKKPFYVPDTGAEEQSSDYLGHQRLQKTESDSLSKAQWYARGSKLPAATKYRKGACENCGAMTHKTKECLSRPRKRGAKWTGRDIQADEVVQDVELGWDAKRDRWNGYDASEYQNIVNEYNEVEAIKKSAGAAIEDGDIYEAETDMGRQQSTSTRNLRLREDKAKYLMDLNLDSAKYDPKTRSMLDAGGGPTGDDADDGFVRQGDEAAEFEKAQRYAWETQERGDANKVHLQANPTAAMMAIKQQKEDSERKAEGRRKALLDKYGGQEQVKSPPVDTRVMASESFVEYDESGGIKGAPKVKAKSRYPEDLFVNNHTSVWGSWWKEFKWGYACCHSTVKNSYCTGEEGKAAYDEAEERRLGADLGDGPPVSTGVGAVDAREEDGDADRSAKQGLESAQGSRGKRTFDMMEDSVTAEEMEEYRKKRAQRSDPMASQLGKDELIQR